MTAQLPPQGPQEPDEHLPGETELAALYRQLPQSEPSAALDAAVLRAAAQALAHGEQNTAPVIETGHPPWEDGDRAHSVPGTAANPPERVRPRSYRDRSSAGSRRWMIALSSAATLVLAAGLAWHMRGMPSTVATPDVSYRSAVSSPEEVASPAAAATPLPSAPPAQDVAVQSAVHLAEPVARLQQPPQAASAAKVAMKRHHVTPSPPVIEEVSETAVALPPPVAEMTRTVKPVADGYSPGSMAPVASAKAARSEVSVAPVTPVPAPPVEFSASVAAPVSAPAAPAPPMPVSAAPAIEKPTALDPGDTPAQELGKIRQLFAQGHDDEARQRLTVFHRAHPEWELSAELDAQLHKP